MANPKFDGQHMAQYWLDERVLKLHIYRERQGDKPHDYVDLIIETQAGDEEGPYGGSYKLSVFDMTGDPTGGGKATALGARSAAARSKAARCRG